MRRVVVLLILLSCLGTVARSQQLYINELMASNNQTVADGTGAYEDWFEIYNPNSFTVNVAGYYVTDNLTNPTKYQFISGTSQTIVPANGFLLVWASGAPSRGSNHIGFSLSAGGEQIGLYRMVNGVLQVVDSLSFGPQRTDISWGRKPDGSSSWLYFQASTHNCSPGSSNNTKTGYVETLTTPVFSQTGGFYSTGFNLTISSADSAVTIYYTLDGSDPDPSNPASVTFAYKNSYPYQSGQPYGPFLKGSYRTYAYTAPITIADRTSAPNSQALKSSTFDYTPTYFPTTSLFKGTVVRAIAYKANAIASDIVTQSYFITPTTPPRYTVPVVSIATTEKNLFDYYTGLYTAGITFDTWRAANPTLGAGSCTPANFVNEGDDWERAANVEFFLNNSSIINQAIGLRIHGGCTVSRPRKSLRLYSSSAFEYPFFANRPPTLSYDRLILRNGGGDWDYTLLIDSYMQTMVRHLPFDTQSNRCSIVFLNGEYWGVQSLDERYDNNYLNRRYGIAMDSVDIVSIHDGNHADEGDLVKYNALYSYFSNTNPVSYTYVNTQVDITNYTDYQISEIFAANTDWPQNNQMLWRKRTSQFMPKALDGHDGRWRWMMKDMDYGLSGQNDASHNTLAYATQDNYATLFIRRLLAISTYKTYFINRYADLLNTTFSTTRTVDLLTSMQQEYQPYMAEHFDRWKTASTVTTWLTNVGKIRTFVQQRPAYARDHIRAKFNLTANRSLTVTVSNTAQGYIKVNTIDLLPTTEGVAASPYPWTGIYFDGNPITLVARAYRGYAFQYWLEGNTIVSTDTAYSFNPTANRSLQAVFQPNDSFNSIPVSYTLVNCDYRFTNWPSTAQAGSYPDNMQFVMMGQEDPPLSATIASPVTGAYSYTSRTRINGLGENGISFINTGNSNTNPGYIASTLGGALLALRTTGLTEATVQWTGGTVTPNSRQYAIRLRYRLGDSGAFTDLLDGSANPVEYVRNATAGHSQVIGPISLPASLLNKPYVQLLWQYYWTGVGASGPRDEIRLDDIIIKRGQCVSLASGAWNLPGTWSCGRVPTVCDAVLIGSGHIVTLTMPNAVARSIQFSANSRLVYADASASLLLQGSN